MILEVLFVFVIILIVAHIFTHFSIKNKNNEKNQEWGFAKEAETIARGEVKETADSNNETEITLPVNKPRITENSFMDYGKVIANEQKIKILNHRFDNLERAFSELANKKGIDSDIDLEKIDFKLKVLEKEIENIKHPKKQEHTFYGQKNDPLEKEIRALVFNTKKK